MMNNSFVKFLAYLMAFGVFGPIASWSVGGFVLDVQGIALAVVLVDILRVFAPSWRAFSDYLRERVSEGGESIVLDSKKDKGKLAVYNAVKSIFSPVFAWFGSPKKADAAADRAEEQGKPVEIRLDRTKNEAKV